jgi:hypothetical protein
MAMKRLSFLGLRRSRDCVKCFALVFLLFAMTFASCIDGEAQSDPVVVRNLEAFFEAFLGRKLSGSELREVTDEFIKYHARKGKTRAATHEWAQTLGSYVKILREGKGGPADFTLRHIRIEWNYFDPDIQNSTFLRLLTEPDPVRVVNPRSRRLMTERDVVALANIRDFAKSEGDPRHRELSRQEIDRLVAGLDRFFGAAPKAGAMPQFFGETAAFWAGVRREWPRLSAKEKSLARAYANKTWRIRMEAPMYGKLLGLSPKAALSRQMDDVSNRLTMITNIQLEITNLPILLDKIFPP